MKKLMLMIFSLFLVSGIAFAQQGEQKIRIGLDIVLMKNDKPIYESDGMSLSGYNRNFLVENNVSYIKEAKKNENGVIDVIPGIHKSGEYLTIKPIVIDSNNINIEYSLLIKKLISLDDFELNGVKIQIPKESETKFSNTIKINPNELKVIEFKTEKDFYKLHITVNY